jgi:site-specific recombinase XerD
MARKVWVPVVSGPLAPYAAGFESWLRSRSYSSSAAADRMYQLDQLSRWLGREGLSVGELTGDQAERFAAARRAAGLVSWASPQSVTLPLGYLRTLGVAPVPAPVVAQSLLEDLLEDYRRYLSAERGLCDHTVLDAYGPAARLFLAGRGGPDGLGLERLCAADVTSFLAGECPKRSMSGARDLVCALRSLLRYLHLAGVIEVPLVWAVPSVADLRDRTLPRGLEPGTVKKLLASCDRRRSVGRRDFAILLLLSRLGLRAGEVAGLRLDDVDWRRGELLVRGKGGRHDVLPLPVDVGEAVVSYLHRRPRCERRDLFLRMTAPRQGLNRSTIGWVVRAACDRAGLARVGAHRLRHTAATGMLRQGASLGEIGQVLRHREQKTTALYAKVDRIALGALVRPWPSSPGGAA